MAVEWEFLDDGSVHLKNANELEFIRLTSEDIDRLCEALFEQELNRLRELQGE